MPPPELAPWHQALVDSYVARLPDRLAELAVALEAAEQGGPEQIAALHAVVHRLHGSAGTHGLAELGEVLGVWERILQAGEIDDGAAWMSRIRASVGPAGEAPPQEP